MRIPKTFKLGTRKWHVKTDTRYLLGFLRGRVFATLSTIHLCPKLTEAEADETFWHEVTHAILHDMGDHRWNDEKFVTAFSKRLTQVVNTAKV